ncbi:MAG: cysteine desulfurase [Sphingobacteriales bacterium JAD_PAG50586_3]|nr:MAG: cysteine desulfurase [Sphingobacteriales bacterium JAD_PAG50586_3]
MNTNTNIAPTVNFDVEKIRADFPILQTTVYGRPLVYLDNGATAQKPLAVINSMVDYYKGYNANVHRGVHFLSQKATDAHELVREKVQAFINAEHTHEVIFTRGTTESVNIVAHSFGKAFVKAGDEIIITAMEHHSNIVPWQMLCEERGAKLRVIPINADGELILEEYEKLLNERTKLVALVHVSNTLGTVNPVNDIIAKAHAVGAAVLIDGAQSVQHMAVDVQAMDADFFVFSGHKLFGPTGIGVLYGKEKYLNAMPPYQGGGSMIKQVTFEKTTYNDLPFKFEAGTPHVEGIIGLGAAIDYINAIGIDNIAAYEHDLVAYAVEQLSTIEGLRFVGNAKERVSVLSFLIGDIHPYDVGVLLDKLGIAVRTGHHCCQPIMEFYSIPGTIRASFAFYNTKAEVDALVAGLLKAKSMLS